MLNRIVLQGRLVREPELRYTQANVPVCTVSLACERDFARQGEKREVDFIDVVCWRGLAEFVAKWFGKGSLVAVEGRLTTRTWKDRYEQHRVTFEVQADNVYFCEKAERRETAPAYSASAGGTMTGQKTILDINPAGVPLPQSDFDELMDDDDVPF